MTSARIIVVDEVPWMEPPLARSLATAGYQVRAVQRERVLANVARWRPDMLFIDNTRSYNNGVELCRRVRARSRIPIVFVAPDPSEQEQANALDCGGDGYVRKPIGVEELLARTRALLRRTSGERPQSMECGPFKLDGSKRLVHMNGHHVRRTPNEFQLLAYLAARPHRVVERRQLLEAVWGDVGLEHPEYLRVLVGQLRKKLEPTPDHPRYLITEAWVGYRFEPEGPAHSDD